MTIIGLYLTSGTWKVDLDCGGLRYLLPGLALGYAFVTLIYRQPARRLVFLAVCAVLLMVANGIRAYGVIVGDHFGIAEGTDHRVFSYTIYGLTMPLLLWVGLRWQENMTATSFHIIPLMSVATLMLVEQSFSRSLRWPFLPLLRCRFGSGVIAYKRTRFPDAERHGPCIHDISVYPCPTSGKVSGDYAIKKLLVCIQITTNQLLKLSRAEADLGRTHLHNAFSPVGRPWDSLTTHQPIFIKTVNIASDYGNTEVAKRFPAEPYTRRLCGRAPSKDGVVL